MVVTVTAEERFRQLYALHAGPVLSYFKRRTDSETTQDCTAETFLVAWRRIDDVPGASFPWLYGVARRVLQNQRRSGGRMARLVSRLRGLDSPPEPSPELEVIRRFEVSTAAALRRMRPEDQELLLLANWEELRTPTSVGCSAAVHTRSISVSTGRCVGSREESSMPDRNREGRRPPQHSREAKAMTDELEIALRRR